MKLFSICSWIYQPGAARRLILWKPWQIRLFNPFFWLRYEKTDNRFTT